MLHHLIGDASHLSASIFKLIEPDYFLVYPLVLFVKKNNDMLCSDTLCKRFSPIAGVACSGFNNYFVLILRNEPFNSLGMSSIKGMYGPRNLSIP